MGREVALTAFAVHELNLEACGNLSAGEELEMALAEGQGQVQVVILRRGRRLGLAPAQEAGSFRDLMTKGARLGCRVVGGGQAGQDRTVRVRVSILM